MLRAVGPVSLAKMPALKLIRFVQFRFWEWNWAHSLLERERFCPALASPKATDLVRHRQRQRRLEDWWHSRLLDVFSHS
jgi:hypothetical protein